MRVFMTGGTGFIGSWVVRALLDAGHEATILARDPAKVPGFVGRAGVRFVTGDVRETEAWSGALAGHDAVIHNALVWGDSAVEMLERDTRASVALFEAAGRAGVGHVVYTSSVAAFGAFRPRMTEEMPEDPIDWYCATKAASEMYLLAAGSKFGIRVNSIRPGYTFAQPAVEGAPEGPGGFREIVGKAKRGEQIRLARNDGAQFVWAGDLARLYLAVLGAGPDAHRQVYHAVSEPWTSWEEVARLAVERAGSPSEIVFDGDKGRAEPFVFDLSKIREAFGLRFDSRPHIERYVEYLVARV